MNKINNYKLITVTHKTASLKRIGDFVIKTEAGGDELGSALNALKATLGLEELMYVSTCNRVIYLLVGNFELNTAFCDRFFGVLSPALGDGRVQPEEFLGLEGEAAVNHFYEVAASVDSVVVGEREILRQLRESYDQCTAWNLTGDSIRLLMRFLVTAAKRVYNHTRIGEKSVSVVSLAAQLLLRSSRRRDSRLLLIGAGQTNALMSKFLVKYGFANVSVFNRTLEKAAKLSKLFQNGSFHPLESLSHYTKGFDIIIVCTGATTPILTDALYDQLLQGDRDQKLVIDLSVPYNVAASVAARASVEYVEIEHIKALSKENLSFREKEILKAKEILKEEVAEFTDHFKQRQLEVVLGAIPESIKEIKSKALNEVFRKEVELLDEHSRDLVERLMTYMEKKCISIPMRVAKDALVNGSLATT